MILVSIAVAVFVYINFSAFAPILLALLTALIFDPFVRMLMRRFKTEKRIIPVTIVFTVFLIINAFVIYYASTKLINRLTDWVLALPNLVMDIQLSLDKIIQSFNTMIADFPQRQMIINEMNKQSENLVNKAYELGQDLLLSLTSIVQSVPNIIFVSLFFLMSLFLFSLDLPRIKNFFYSLFKEETEEKLRKVFKRLGVVFVGYWKAQFLLSIMIFVLTYAALFFIARDLALVMTFVIWLVDIIPLYVGPALILIPWAIIVLILGDTAMAIQLIILTLVLLVIRRITEPKVLGNEMGLAALPTVLSMYFGFVFFGVVGLIAGPFVVVAVQSFKEAGLFKLNLDRN